MKITSLNEYDYASIIGQYNAVYGSDKQSEIETRGYNKKALEMLQAQLKMRGSNYSLNLKFSRPFAEFTYPFFNYVHSLFDQFDRNGVLPFPGSYTEQPAQIIEIFNTLYNLRHEFEQEAIKKAQTKERMQNGRSKNRRQTGNSRR